MENRDFFLSEHCTQKEQKYEKISSALHIFRFILQLKCKNFVLMENPYTESEDSGTLKNKKTEMR